jgi:hypothetical protein
MAAGQVLTRSSGSVPSPSACVVSRGPLGVLEGDAPFGRSCDGRDSPAYRQAPRSSAIAVGLGAAVHQLWGKGLASVWLGLGKTSMNRIDRRSHRRRGIARRSSLPPAPLTSVADRGDPPAGHTRTGGSPSRPRARSGPRRAKRATLVFRAGPVANLNYFISFYSVTVLDNV